MKSNRVQQMMQRSNAWNQLLNWYQQQIEYPEVFNELDTTRELSAEKVLKTLLITTVPRFLYDFFDDEEIKLFVVEARKGEWLYTISGQPIDMHSDVSSFPTRTQAEEDGFYQAFLALESRLSVHKPAASE